MLKFSSLLIDHEILLRLTESISQFPYLNRSRIIGNCLKFMNARLIYNPRHASWKKGLTRLVSSDNRNTATAIFQTVIEFILMIKAA